MRSLGLPLLLTTLLPSATAASAGAWYVDDSGSDSKDGGGLHYTTVSNDIVDRRSGARYAWAPTTGITYRTNCWYGGTGDVTGNPQLVSAGGWDADDYPLTSTSPLETAGTTESGVTIDHFGGSRTASYSIGAHEY